MLTQISIPVEVGALARPLLPHLPRLRLLQREALVVSRQTSAVDWQSSLCSLYFTSSRDDGGAQDALDETY